MKRLACLALGILLAGCAPKPDVFPPEPSHPSADNPQPTSPVAPAPATPAADPTPAPAPSSAPAPAPVAVNPAAIPDTSPSVGPPPAPAPAKDLAIFETVKDGKTYVFVSIAAMNAFTTSGTPQPVVSEKPDFSGGGITVVFEAADQAQAEQMRASYRKLHPPAAK